MNRKMKDETSLVDVIDSLEEHERPSGFHLGRNNKAIRWTLVEKVTGNNSVSICARMLHGKSAVDVKRDARS